MSQDVTIHLRPRRASSWRNVGLVLVGAVTLCSMLLSSDKVLSPLRDFWYVGIGFGAFGLLGLWGSRPLTIVLTPKQLRFIRGGKADIFPWREIEVVELTTRSTPNLTGRITTTVRVIAIRSRTRDTMNLDDLYETPQKDLHRTLAAYTAVHAPHIRTEPAPGWRLS